MTEAGRLARRTGASQVAVGLALLALWEIGGRLGAGLWISRPSLVGAQIAQWLTGPLYINLYATMAEIFIGLVIGCTLGIIAGLLLGRAPLARVLLRPIIVGLYSVPLVALAPLFIMFFGLGLLPKIVLVSIVVFFLMFFNTFAGAQGVDAELIAVLTIMGARPGEMFRKVVVPASVPWIVSGLKIAIPYAMVAAVTGEMLASRNGLGQILMNAGETYDITSMFAVLLILMLIGILLTTGFARCEERLLRWRKTKA